MATVNFKGNPIQLAGEPPVVGAAAPEFELVGGDMSTVKLSDSAGKLRVISVIPSIDTPTCELQTRHFNKQFEGLSDNVVGYTVSVDTPFAQNRWCGTEGVTKMQLLSDYKGHNFGRDYGLYLPDLGLLARSVFIVDGDGKVVYSQIVPEISQEPNYAEVAQKIEELTA